MKRSLFGLLLAGTALLWPVAGEAGPKDRSIKDRSVQKSSATTNTFRLRHAAAQDRTLLALESLADKGSARAQFELAQRYDGAQGTTRNSRLALTLYCKAARQGHAEAAERAGRMLLKGAGAPGPDEELGNAWLRKAKAGGGGKSPEKCEPPQFRSTGYAFSAPPAQIKTLVHKMAPKYGLDPDLVLAVISVESAFRNDVVSHKNAMGLMQLIPETAARFGVSDPFDAQQNIRGGMMYLRWLLAYFAGDVTLALAGYNAGEGAVLKHRGVPPYAETQDYVVKVHSLYKFKRHPFDGSVTEAAALPAKARPAGKEEVAELSYAAAPKRPQPKSASIED